MTDPPALLRQLGDTSIVIAVGTGLWLLGAVSLLVAWLVAGRPPDIWLTTCVAGALLGGLGYGVFTWQRGAARRGSRTAQSGVR